MLRSAQRKSTGLSIPPRPFPSNLFGEHNQFLAAWGGTACALPVNGRLTLRQGDCVQLVVEPMNGRLYLAVKAYGSGRRACRCATWCFNRCQVHVEISGNGVHPVPPSQLCFVDPRPPSPAANMGREIIAKVSLDDGALAWGLDPRCPGQRAVFVLWI